MWIEIFRTGEHTDSSGQKRMFSEEMLDSIAGLYNGKVKKSASFEAPLVKGHPKSDAPAYGWVESLKRKGEVLLAKLKDVSAGLVDEVKKGMFRKVSIALYPDMMLRHVGILGAAAPAVKGLKSVQFDDGMKFSCYTSENNDSIEQNQFTDNNRDVFNRLKELENENSRLKAQIINDQKLSRLIEFREFANALIDNEEGAIITPAQAADLVDLLELAYISDSSENEYTDGHSNVSKIKNLFLGMKPKFSTKELPLSSHSTEFKDEFSDMDNVRPERYALHQKALEIQNGQAGLAYEEALCLAQKERGT